jgi:ribose 5-phosphate isomerase B
MADNQMSIIIGCDHAAFSLKEKIKALITDIGLKVHDAGTHSTDSVDYPDFGAEVSQAVSSGIYKRGILLCGTGIGMSMTANKFPGVRAALCWDLFTAMMSRRHNNANILVMGARVTGDILATEMVRVWLETPFEGGRHQARLDRITEISKRICCTSNNSSE